MNTSEIHQFGTSILDQHAILIALALMVLAITIYLGQVRINRAWLSFKARYTLNHLGIKQISRFRFPDGLGQYIIIDRLVMRHDGISLLIFIRYPGHIFCADDITEWTQMLAGKSYRFNNPLVDLDYQIKAVSACIPDVPVNGFLLFDRRAKFPKGHPDRVIQLKTLPEELKQDKQNKAQAPVESAWEKLLTLSGAK